MVSVDVKHHVYLLSTRVYRTAPHEFHNKSMPFHHGYSNIWLLYINASVDRFHMAESVIIAVYRRKNHDVCLFVEIKSLVDVIVLT